MVKPKQAPAKLGKLRTKPAKPAKPAKPQAVVTLLEIVSHFIVTDIVL